MQVLPRTKETHQHSDAWSTTGTVSSEDLQETYFSVLASMQTADSSTQVDAMRTAGSPTQVGTMQTAQFSPQAGTMQTAHSFSQVGTMQTASYFSQDGTTQTGYEQYQYSGNTPRLSYLAEASATPPPGYEHHGYLMNLPVTSSYEYTATTYPPPSMYPTYNGPYAPMVAPPAGPLQPQFQQPQYYGYNYTPMMMAPAQNYASMWEDGQDERQETLARQSGQ
jgi:hypothetical protein